MAKRLSWKVGTTGPPISDTITVDGQAQDLTGATATFRLRRHDVNFFKVNAAAVIITPQTGVNKGKLRYDWVLADTDEAGEYFGSWRVVLADSSVLETDEFQIWIDEDTTTGDTTVTGAIARKVRSLIPKEWRYLAKDEDYGEPLLQDRIDYVKFKLFNTVVAPSLEATCYNPLVLDFAGKVSTIQLIPAAVDYMMQQPRSVSATGTNENTSYHDRIDALWKLHERLLAEVKKDADLVDDWVVTRNKGIGPAVSTAGLPFKSGNPQDFFNQGRDPNNVLSVGPFWDD